MPAITATSVSGDGRVTATEITLNGTDSLVYVNGNNQLLVFRNPTGSAITPTISSNGPSTFRVPGVGSVSVSSFAVGSIAAGAVAAIPLDTISQFLTGTTVTIGTGSGLVATLFNR